jgi:L-fucose isomerase-like protein
LSHQFAPYNCEVDVDGTITPLMLQCLSVEPVFRSDQVSVDAAEGVAILWRGGLASLYGRSGIVFSTRRRLMEEKKKL